MRNNITKTVISVMLVLSMLLSFTFTGSGKSDTVSKHFYHESFEGKYDGWRPVGGGRYDKSGDYASDGNYSLKLTDTTTNYSAGFRSPELKLEEGKYYDISVDVYNDSGNATAFIEFWNGPVGNMANRTDNISSTATATGKWTTLNFSVSVPKGTSGTTVLLYSGKTNKGIMYFDNITVDVEKGGDTQELIDFELKTDAYPRLFFTDGELEEIKQLKTDKNKNSCGFIGEKTVSSLLAEADRLLTQSSFKMTYYSTTDVVFKIPFEEKHFTSSPSGFGGSNFPYWQEMGNKMKDMMQTLSLAYSLTGNEKYAMRAIELMDSLCKFTTWTEYPTINRTSLETGYFTVGVSTVYDMCYNKLTELQKANAEKALKDKGLSKLYADLSSFTDHNYYVNKATALAVGSCLLYGKDADAQKYLSRAYSFIKWYLDERLNSESNEGLSYTSYSMDLISGALDSIKRVTGKNDLMSSKYFSELFIWAVMSSDCEHGYGPPISDVYNDTYFYITSCVMNREQENGLAGWYMGTRSFKVPDFARIVYYCKDVKVESPQQYEDRTGENLTNGIIKAAGWGALRSSWNKDGNLLVCVGNNSSQGHSHFDQNSFVLSVNGTWLFGDPGYQDYGGGSRSDYTLSYGHSTVYVDGKSQSYKGKGSLTTLLDSPSYSYILGSAGGAYSNLTDFDRGFMMINHSKATYYVITDKITSDSAHKYSFVLNADNISSFRDIREDGTLGYISKGSDLNADKFVVSGKGAAAKVSMDRVSDISYGPWNSVGSLINIDGGEASKNGNFCVLIAPISGSVNESSVKNAVTVTESFTNSNQNGIKASYGEFYDIILTSNTKGVNGGGVESDGKSATIFTVSGDDFGGFSMTDGKTLSYNGKSLISSDKNISASFNFDTGECVIKGVSGTKVKVYAPGGIDGYDSDDEGYCSFELKSENEKIDIGKNKVPVTSTEITSSNQAGETNKNGQKVAIIVSSVAILVVAVSLTVIFVFKKRKNK